MSRDILKEVAEYLLLNGKENNVLEWVTVDSWGVIMTYTEKPTKSWGGLRVSDSSVSWNHRTNTKVVHLGYIQGSNHDEFDASKTIFTRMNIVGQLARMM